MLHQPDHLDDIGTAARERSVESSTSTGAALEAIEPVLQSCLRWVRSRPPPPRWSCHDWHEELEAVARAAAWRACEEFQPGRETAFATFVHGKVTAAAWTRYRQECAYGRRLITVIALDGSGSEGTAPGLEPRDTAPGPHEAAMRMEMCNQLDLLPEEERVLIRLIFFDGRTESELSKNLGISQVAVSKRKERVLAVLRKRALLYT